MLKATVLFYYDVPGARGNKDWRIYLDKVLSKVKSQLVSDKESKLQAQLANEFANRVPDMFELKPLQILPAVGEMKVWIYGIYMHWEAVILIQKSEREKQTSTQLDLRFDLRGRSYKSLFFPLTFSWNALDGDWNPKAEFRDVTYDVFESERFPQIDK